MIATFYYVDSSMLRFIALQILQKQKHVKVMTTQILKTFVNRDKDQMKQLEMLMFLQY